MCVPRDRSPRAGAVPTPPLLPARLSGAFIPAHPTWSWNRTRTQSVASTASTGSVTAAGTRTAKKDGTLAPNSARPPLTPAPKKLVRRRKAAQETQDADSLAVKPTTETAEAEGGRRRSSSFDVSKKVPRTQSMLTLVEATRAPLSNEDVDAEAEHAPDGDEDGA